MKEKIKLRIKSITTREVVLTITSISIIAIILISQIVYANNFENKTQIQNGFFKTDKEEASQGDYITMTIDLTQIEYDEFKFTLIADSNLQGNVSTNNEDTKNNTKISTTADGDTITITAKKSELDLDTITLYYKVPDNLATGSKITFTAKIENTTQSVEKNTTNNIEQTQTENVTSPSIKNTEESNNTNISNTIGNETTGENTISNELNNTTEQNLTNNQNSTESQYKETTITITIVDKSDIQNNNDKNLLNTENQTNPGTSNMQIIQNSSSQSITTKTTTSIAASIGSASQTTAETYKGSYINYLTNITIKGYSLTPEFSMTNTTYTLEVENNVTSIDIETTKYDSSSTVKIYGNTDLKVGQNKILISVTAENGSVRTYRIYVTRNS